MRKILLGTTAVAGFALFAVSTAQAQQAPTVRLGGVIMTQMNWQDDDLDGTGAGPTGVRGAGAISRDAIDFKNEVEFIVTVAGKAANGLEYGAVVEIQNDNIGGSTLDLDEAYVFVSSPTLGTIRFGEEDSAANLLQVRHPFILGGGSDGEWDDGLASTGAFTAGGPSLLASMGNGGDATKIIYLSPQFAGFDFGISFAPNGNEGDRVIANRALDTLSLGAGAALDPTNGHRDPTGLTNEITIALRYRGTVGGVGIAAGVGYQTAEGARSTAAGARTSALTGQDMNAYKVGLNQSAFGFTVGGEYVWGSYQGVVNAAPTTKTGQDDSSHYVLGVTYTAGAISVGAFYGVAEQDTNTAAGAPKREQTVWGISGLYTLAPGLDVYATYANLQDSNVNIAATGRTTLRDREASVLLLGTRLTF